MFSGVKTTPRLLSYFVRKKICQRAPGFSTSSLLLSDDQSKEIPISRFPVPKPDELPQDLKDKFGKLSTNWRMADLDKRQKAILDFAVDVANGCAQSDERFQRLYEYGMTHDDAWDIGSLASFLSMSNRLAKFLRVRPNAEFYFIGRIPPGTGQDEKS